jgi:hypothetical protein
MSRYTPVAPTPSYPPRPPSHHRSASSSAAGRPSQQREMEAAFDDSDGDSDDDDENLPLSQARSGRDLVWDAGDDAGLPDEDARAGGVSASSTSTPPLPTDGVDDPLRRPSTLAAPAPRSLQSTDAEPTYDFDRDYVSLPQLTVGSVVRPPLHAADGRSELTRELARPVLPLFPPCLGIHRAPTPSSFRLPARRHQEPTLRTMLRQARRR